MRSWFISPERLGIGGYVMGLQASSGGTESTMIPQLQTRHLLDTPPHRSTPYLWVKEVSRASRSELHIGISPPLCQRRLLSIMACILSTIITDATCGACGGLLGALPADFSRTQGEGQPARGGAPEG